MILNYSVSSLVRRLTNSVHLLILKSNPPFSRCWRAVLKCRITFSVSVVESVPWSVPRELPQPVPGVRQRMGGSGRGTRGRCARGAALPAARTRRRRLGLHRPPAGLRRPAGLRGLPAAVLAGGGRVLGLVRVARPHRAPLGVDRGAAGGHRGRGGGRG